MIFTDRTIIVQKGTSSINDTIILYRGDKGVEIRFTLNEGSPFRFGSGASPNIIEKTEAAYGQLIIKRPNDLPAVFSEIAPTNKGKIVFTITAEMIDEITEVGNYTFQIRLLDESRNSRATLPEVVDGIEIREPIASEDISDTNEVGVATVGYALTTAGTPEDAFDSEGNYNKTTWVSGDRITAAKLNKIEAGIDGVNKKIASAGTSGGSNINDTTASATTTYSSNKIESIKEGLSSQIENIASKFTTEQTDNLYKIKYEGIIIAEIPIGNTPSTLKTFGNLLSRISAWNVMGNSITDETINPTTKYPTILKNKYTNITTLNNYGRNGWSVAVKSDSSFGSFLTLIDSMSSSCDLITIAGGVNDFLHCVPIGERSSTLDTEFYGAVNNLITRLKVKYPNATIIWIMPLPIRDGVYESNEDGTNPIGNTLDDYRKALRNKLHDLQVPAIDLSTDPDMDPSKISTDGLHPTAAGQEIYANKLDNSIPSIPLGEQIINCTNVVLNPSTLTFTDINSQTLVATVTPSNTTDTIVWESSNKDIVTVNNGVVTPISNGECTITATCGTQTATCAVTVSDMSESGGGTGVNPNLVFQVNRASMNTADNTLTDNIAGISATLTGNPTISDNQIAFTANDKFSFDISSLNLTSSNRTVRVKFTPANLSADLQNVITFGESATTWERITSCYVSSQKLVVAHGHNNFSDNTVGSTQGAHGNNRLLIAPAAGQEYELVISENIDGNVRWFVDGTLVQDGTTTLFDPLYLSNVEGENRFKGSYSLIEIYDKYCNDYTEFTNMVNN